MVGNYLSLSIMDQEKVRGPRGGRNSECGSGTFYAGLPSSLGFGVGGNGQIPTFCLLLSGPSFPSKRSAGPSKPFIVPHSPYWVGLTPLP